MAVLWMDHRPSSAIRPEAPVKPGDPGIGDRAFAARLFLEGPSLNGRGIRGSDFDGSWAAESLDDSRYDAGENAEAICSTASIAAVMCASVVNGPGLNLMVPPLANVPSVS